jgi:C1A family cysteine protease
MGWIPDYPDIRDYTKETAEVREILAGGEGGGAGARRAGGTGRTHGARAALPAKVDLREWCSAVEDQGMLGSCTANAGAGVIEYYERRTFKKHVEVSRLFLYKVTRNLMKMKGDTGGFLRTTMGAMVLFGVPPEDYWPYTDSQDGFDREPPAFCYAFAQNYQAIKYYRHDPPGSRLAEVRERIEGGHAIIAVGYNDKMKIENRGEGAGAGITTTEGAFLIRNSRGESWGEAGYGWLPYEYVTRGLAEDFWSVLKKEWIDTGEFVE